MKLFLESASLEAVEDALDIGAVDGVVLGPEGARLAASALRKLTDALFDLAVGPVIVDLALGVGADVEAALARARKLAELGDEIACRLPATLDGLAACRGCFDEGIATWVGPCATVAQALLAAKAGATWIGVDVGAVESQGGDGVKLAEDVATLVNDCDFEAQVLADGVNDARHVGELALSGVHAAVVSPELLASLVPSPPANVTGRPAGRGKRR